MFLRPDKNIFTILVLSLVKTAQPSRERSNLKRNFEDGNYEAASDEALKLEPLQTKIPKICIDKETNNGMPAEDIFNSIKAITQNFIKSELKEKLDELLQSRNSQTYNEDKFIGTIKEYLIIIEKEKNEQEIKRLASALTDNSASLGLQVMYQVALEHKLSTVLSIVSPKIAVVLPYECSNLTFLKVLLSPDQSGRLTAMSIHSRFKTGFLKYLSPSQIIEVIIALLSTGRLRLLQEDRLDLIDHVFGHIDLMKDAEFSTEQVVRLVTATLDSSVPECFENVFLTWKFWRAFRLDQQAVMLRPCYVVENSTIRLRESHKRETLIMLYFFVRNVGAHNSLLIQCLRTDIMNREVPNYNKRKMRNEMQKVLMEPGMNEDILSKILARFDVVLLCLPEIGRKMDSSRIEALKRYLQERLYDKNSRTLFNLQYSAHFCYVLTKFIRRTKESINIPDDLYFAPQNLMNGLRDAIIQSDIDLEDEPLERSSLSLLSCINSTEVKNMLSLLRLVIQSEEYDAMMFVDLYRLLYNAEDGFVGVLYLILLTKESIIRNVTENQLRTHKICLQRTRSETNDTSKFVCNLKRVFLNISDGSALSFSDYLSSFNLAVCCFSDPQCSGFRYSFVFQRIFLLTDFSAFGSLSIMDYIYELEKTALLADNMETSNLIRNLVIDGSEHNLITAEVSHSINIMVDLKMIGIFTEVPDEIYSCMEAYRNRERSMLSKQ